MRRFLVILSACLFASFAGCVDPSEPAPTPVDGPVPPDDVTPKVEVPIGPPGRIPLRFGGAAHDERFTVSGTFHIGQAADPIGFLAWQVGQDTGSGQAHEVSDRMVYGQPSTVTLTLDGPVEHGDLEVFLIVPPGQTWNVFADAPSGGYTSVTYGLTLHEGPVYVFVLYNDPEPTPSFEYTVEVHVRSDPTAIPSPTGALVALEEGDVLNIQRAVPQDEAVPLYLWAPDGSFAGTHQLGTGILRVEAADWGPGMYAFIAAPEAGDLLVFLESGDPASAPQMGIARSKVQMYGPFEGGTVASGVFDVPDMPLRVQAIAVTQTVTPGTVALRVTPPGGVAMEQTAETSLAPQTGIKWIGAWLDASNERGEWTVEADAPTHVGPGTLQVWGIAVYMDLSG